MVRPFPLVAVALLAAAAPPNCPPGRTLPVDPVELVSGRAVPGEPALALEHGRHAYTFASARNRAAFESDPARYEIQLGGACARMGPLSGEGSPDLFAVHGGRIYIFASPQCRGTFLKRAADLLEADDPLPAWTPESRERGRALLDRAVAAMGGAAAIDGIGSVSRRVEEQVASAGKTIPVVESLWIEFPDRAARESRWDESAWGEVVDGGAAFLFAGDESRDMAASQRRAFEKEVGRDPFLILRERGAPGTLVAHTGSAEIDGTPVELVAVARDGRTSTLAIDAQTGAIAAVTYRGRGPGGFFGAREDRYGDFRRTGPLTLPFQRRVFFAGEPVESMSETVAALQIDGAIDPAVFRRRGP
jgi:YHS domain-containing protein